MRRLILFVFMISMLDIHAEFGYYRRRFAKDVKKVGKKEIVEQSILDPNVPMNLQMIPYGEDEGIVICTRTIEIRGVVAPYNPSIVEHKDGYLLLFRYDLFDSKSPHGFFSNIGCVELDRNFQQTEKEFIRIQLPQRDGEDPRVIKVNDKLYVSYNSGLPPLYQIRKIHVAELDMETYQPKFTTCLDTYFSDTEKNWAPFEYVNEDEESQICFEYSIFPRKVFGLPDPIKNELKYVNSPYEVVYRKLPWESFGILRGGTGARRVGDQYLGFFHSSFPFRDGTRWYVIGAYTFDSKPPFEITGMSHYPILFEDIYASPPRHTANPLVKCLFPGGFVIEENEDGDLIHLVCGENDSAIRIVTIDQENLFQNLRDLKRKYGD